MTTNPDITLEPCPFCGAEMLLRFDPKAEYFGPEGDHKKACPIGSIDFIDYADREQALREWNTRHQPTLPEDIAGVVERELGPSWQHFLLGDERVLRALTQYVRAHLSCGGENGN